MARGNGNTLVLSVGATPAVITHFKNVSLSQTRNIIEAPTNTDNGFRKIFPGIAAVTISAEFSWDVDDTAHKELQSSFNAGTELDFSLDRNGDTFAGKAIISDLPNDGSESQELSGSVTLECDLEPTYTPKGP